MNNIYIMATLVVLVLVGTVVVGRFVIVSRHAFLVPQGYVGLFYHNGKYVETLPPGRHIRWGRFVSLETHDTRKSSLAVAGQEVLTADNVGIKASLIVAVQVVDPIKASHETQNWRIDIYNAAQLALRRVVCGVTVEALLIQRAEFGPELLSMVQGAAAKIGIDVTAVVVKDVTIAPELKRAFVDVLKAKQEGQAALERARGESAALRNLANAARLMDGNPALQNLRFMQSISAAQKSGNTLVFGVPGGFVPLTKSGSPAPATDEDAT